MKICSNCAIPKAENEFGLDNRRSDKLQCWCKTCINKKVSLRLRSTLKELRLAVYDKLGHQCSRCGFFDKRALQIDHVYGGGYKEEGGHGSRGVSFLRKVLADTSGMYQILCANCNWIKRSENKETKPIIHN